MIVDDNEDNYVNYDNDDNDVNYDNDNNDDYDDTVLYCTCCTGKCVGV